MSIFEGRFSGRKAIITGGASGLGKRVAKRLVAEGAEIAIWDRDPAAMNATIIEIGAGLPVQVDVTSAPAVKAGALQSIAFLRSVDILVCAAGITGATAAVHEYPLDSWRQVIDVNLNGTFYACREVVPYMMDKGYGRIVNVASVAGKEGNPNAAAYSASKAGVIGLTKSLGKELATKGVIANCLTPTTFDSPILAQLPQSQIDYMKGKIPMGRLAGIDEVAAMVCYMASQECSFTTASVFDVSGGRTTY